MTDEIYIPCVSQGNAFIVHRVRTTGNFQANIQNANTVGAPLVFKDRWRSCSVTLSVRGRVLNGDTNGRISEGAISSSPFNAPAWFRVSWGAGVISHEVVFSVTRNAFVHLPPGQTCQVDYLSSSDIINTKTQAGEYTWTSIPSTAIYANRIEVSIAEIDTQARTEQLVACDFFVPAMGAARPVLLIPASAYELQYTPYYDAEPIATLDGFDYPADPLLRGRPFWLRTLETGFLLPGGPISIGLTGIIARNLVDRSSVAMVSHSSQMDTRALAVFTIRNP